MLTKKDLALQSVSTIVQEVTTTCNLRCPTCRVTQAKMKPEWMAPTYDLLRKNCVFFSREFVAELGCGDIPEYIYKLANMGAAIEDYYSGTSKEEKKTDVGHAAAAGINRPSAKDKTKTAPYGVTKSPETTQRKDEKPGTQGENELLDDVMATRMQRAYRASIINRRYQTSVSA